MAKDSAFPTFTISSGGVPLCWGCAAEPDQVCRLGVQRIDVDRPAAAVIATAQCPSSWQGGPGVAHGGWICCVFDEVLGRLPSALDVPCVTKSLSVSFRRPVPIEQPVLVTAKVSLREGRRWVIEGMMSLASDTDSAELARGTAEFVEPALTHFDNVARGNPS